MDLAWSREQTELYDRVVAFAQRELGASVADRDRKEEFDHAAWRKCAEFGILGLPIPLEYGGAGVDPLGLAHALEGLGYGCRDNGLLFSLNAQMWGCQLPILRFGTDAQRRRYLPALCGGHLIGAHAMSESESGSDAYSLKSTAERRGDRYVLNGAKTFVSNAPVADVCVVFATVNRARGVGGVTAFVVERGAKGFSVSRNVEKMGLRTSPMGDVALHDCEVPIEQRRGREGAGLGIFTHSMEWERSYILATAVGAMARQLERCVRYARERRQFGAPIGKFQMVLGKLVDMRVRLETSRALLHRAAWLKARKRVALADAALAKLHISECWTQSCLDAIQIHGAYGYMTELEVERDLRDAIGSRLYSGTSEIQRLVIGQLMGL